jgi:hypothetical protein
MKSAITEALFRAAYQKCSDYRGLANGGLSFIARSYTTRRYWPTPHYLARGNPVPPYGKYRIAHPRMVVALCLRSICVFAL